VHRGLRSLADEVTATFARIFAYVGLIAGLVVLAAYYADTPEVRAAVAPTPRADWTAVDHRYPAFAVNAPGLGEPDYVVRRHAAGGRKDVMAFGVGDHGSRLLVEVYRPGREIEQFGEPASEVAAQTASLGGPFPLRPVAAIEGKFGRVSAFEFTAGIGGGTRNCLGFVRGFDEPQLQIAGWYCKAEAEVVDRRTLACAIEGLALLAAASEPKVQALFAAAEQKRTFCSSRGNAHAKSRASTIRRADWIEAPRRPKLRGRMVAK
jgi:hypothetical protein